MFLCLLLTLFDVFRLNIGKLSKLNEEDIEGDLSMSEISKIEIRKTMATSLGTAFGIVIGMVWTQVVLSAFATSGISLTNTGGTWIGWGLFVVTAIIVTLLCVIAIVILSRWGGKEQ